jgi:serine/threonine protein kinase
MLNMDLLWRSCFRAIASRFVGKIICAFLVLHLAAHSAQGGSVPIWISNSKGERVAQLLAVNEELGSGAAGAVHHAVIRLVSGEKMDVALKFDVASATSDEHAKRVESSHKLNTSFLQNSPTYYFRTEIGGLYLEETPIKQTPIIVGELMKGTATKLNLVNQSDEAVRVSTLHTLLVQGKYALRELAKDRLVHGDIKPENILFERSLHGIRFAIADNDQLIRVGREGYGFTSHFVAPEYLVRSRVPSASARDIYAFSISLYDLMFGIIPWLEYMEADPQGSRLFQEIANHVLRNSAGKSEEAIIQQIGVQAQKELFGDEARYRDFLRWLEKRLQDRASQYSSFPEVAAKFKDLSEFVLRGLSYDTKIREQALNLNQSHEASAKLHCSQILDSLLTKLTLLKLAPKNEKSKNAASAKTDRHPR